MGYLRIGEKSTTAVLSDAEKEGLVKFGVPTVLTGFVAGVGVITDKIVASITGFDGLKALGHAVGEVFHSPAHSEMALEGMHQASPEIIAESASLLGKLGMFLAENWHEFLPL